MGKRKIARNEEFLFFPRCFLLSQIIVSPFVHIFEIIFLFAAEIEEPKVGISGKGLMYLHGTKPDSVVQNILTLSQTSPGFYVSAAQVF